MIDEIDLRLHCQKLDQKQQDKRLIINIYEVKELCDVYLMREVVLNLEITERDMLLQNLVGKRIWLLVYQKSIDLQTQVTLLYVDNLILKKA